MSNGTCSLPDCSKPVKRRGYCYGHYMKAWRYGTPVPTFEPTWSDITGLRFGALVVIERHEGWWLCACDCGAQRTARIGDLKRAGDASSCGNRTIHRRIPDAGYSAAHDRVRRDRGPVNLRDCIQCDQPARHWSYDHDDPDELLAYNVSSRPVAYSLKPEHYSPRCVKCHKRFDLDRRDAAPIPA